MRKGGGSKLDRKTIEKNRRLEMKCLCLKMVSLIPSHHFNSPKEFLPQQDQLEQAADYIKKLSERVEDLKSRKAQLSLRNAGNDSTRKNPPNTNKSELLPFLNIRELGTSLEVVLISGLRENFKLHQVIRVLEEEGTEVVSISFSKVDDKIFHTLHAQVKVARVGVDVSRIRGRLEELIS